jgi:hypothetical protein
MFGFQSPGNEAGFVVKQSSWYLRRVRADTSKGYVQRTYLSIAFGGSWPFQHKPNLPVRMNRRSISLGHRQPGTGLYVKLNKITTPENVVPVKSMSTEFRNRSEHKMDELPKSMATISLSGFDSGKKGDPVPTPLSNILQKTTSLLTRPTGWFRCRGWYLGTPDLNIGRRGVKWRGGKSRRTSIPWWRVRLDDLNSGVQTCLQKVFHHGIYN